VGGKRIAALHFSKMGANFSDPYFFWRGQNPLGGQDKLLKTDEMTFFASRFRISSGQNAWLILSFSKFGRRGLF